MFKIHHTMALKRFSSVQTSRGDTWLVFCDHCVLQKGFDSIVEAQDSIDILKLTTIY